MKKRNCWEFKKCGREPGGREAAIMGVCPAAADKRAAGIHGGTNGGRACWILTGTLCGGHVQGSFSRKIGSCRQCDFYNLVDAEERGVQDNTDILYAIKHSPNAEEPDSVEKSIPKMTTRSVPPAPLPRTTRS